MLNRSAIVELLRRPCGLGSDLTVVETCVSTNDEVADRLATAAPGAMPVVVAETQTGGRGRRGRTWVLADEGGLAFSFGWPLPERLETNPGLAALVAGGALAAAAHALTGAPPGLKYPNDLLVGGRKAAGILSEKKAGADGFPYAVIGVGVNVTAAPPIDRFDAPPPGGLACVADLASGRGAVTRERFLAAFLNAADYVYGRLACGDVGVALESFRRYDATAGKRVTVAGAGGPFTGDADGIDDNGALQVRLDDGTELLVVSGEVTFPGVSSQA